MREPESPRGAKEGTVVVLIESRYSIDKVETEKRKKAVQDLVKELWAD